MIWTAPKESAASCPPKAVSVGAHPELSKSCTLDTFGGPLLLTLPFPLDGGEGSVSDTSDESKRLRPGKSRIFCSSSDDTDI